MIKLITLEDEKPVISPEARTIHIFRKLIERDKGKVIAGDADGRKKVLAMLELSFIYFYSDPRSPYVESFANDEDLRTEKIKRILGLPETWKPDALLKEAIASYKADIEDDFDIQFLQANISSASKTKDWLNNVDYELRDMKGNMLYKPLEVAKVNKEAGGLLESLKSLREKAFKSEKLNTRVRGGGQVGRYEN